MFHRHMGTCLCRRQGLVLGGTHQRISELTDRKPMKHPNPKYRRRLHEAALVYGRYMALASKALKVEGFPALTAHEAQTLDELIPH